MEETVTAREHLEALQEANDRRYSEVAEERARALQIKEEGDAKALVLAAEIQTYKDKVHNGAIDILKEGQGKFATKDEIRPIADYVTNQHGRSQGLSTSAKFLIGTITVMTFVIPLVVLIANGVF